MCGVCGCEQEQSVKQEEEAIHLLLEVQLCGRGNALFQLFQQTVDIA
jgi:hypothetical protein